MQSEFDASRKMKNRDVSMDFISAECYNVCIANLICGGESNEY